MLCCKVFLIIRIGYRRKTQLYLLFRFMHQLPNNYLTLKIGNFLLPLFWALQGQKKYLLRDMHMQTYFNFKVIPYQLPLNRATFMPARKSPQQTRSQQYQKQTLNDTYPETLRCRTLHQN